MSEREKGTFLGAIKESTTAILVGVVIGLTLSAISTNMRMNEIRDANALAHRNLWAGINAVVYEARYGREHLSDDDTLVYELYFMEDLDSLWSGVEWLDELRTKRLRTKR